MIHTYYIADVFTSTPFQGVQIAVFPDADALPEDLLAVIARELSLSQTVFVYRDSKSDSFRLRAFTPHGESEFVGHPILAAARGLMAAGTIVPTESNQSLTFVGGGGVESSRVEVNYAGPAGRALFVQFTLRSQAVTDRFTPTDAELSALLSISPSDIHTHIYHTRLVSTGLPYLMVPLGSQAAVRRARFNVEAWSQSSAPAMAAQEIFLFSNRTATRDADFHARILGVGVGAKEDPPIGSAMPAFASYLASHDHIREGTYTFAIDRGTSETRRSLLHIEMDKRINRPLNLRVGGEAVLVSKGELLLPDQADASQSTAQSGSGTIAKLISDSSHRSR